MTAVRAFSKTAWQGYPFGNPSAKLPVMQLTCTTHYGAAYAPHTRRQRGFTLIELLLVLTILVILAGIAMRATNGLADQARFEASQRLMTNLQDAVLGDVTLRQPDGTRIANGFVNDIGAPPSAVGSDPATQLSQLWENSGLTVNSLQDGSQVNNPGIVADGADSDIQLVLGWRGPYLNLPPGSRELKDGWGNTLSLTFNAGVLQAAVSLGSDGQVGKSGDAYSADMGTSSTDFGVEWKGTITGRVQTWDSSGTLVAPAPMTVKLFFPINGHIARRDTTSDGDTGSFSFPDVPVGLRALKVTASGKSMIRYVYVTKGGVNQDLLLK
jgi:prepilin-type N-terminal cleavage/methylation domain-containing protein